MARGLAHITSRLAWAAALVAGEYRAPSLASEGFIHLSTDRQWRATANRFYRGCQGLVLLVIRADLLRAPVRYERVDGDDFPHLYGALNVDAVIEACELLVADDGELDVAAGSLYFER